MNKKVIGAAIVALAAGSLVAANSQFKIVEPQQSQVSEAGYTCPVTGEDLPCPNCCVLNKSK